MVIAQTLLAARSWSRWCTGRPRSCGRSTATSARTDGLSAVRSIALLFALGRASLLTLSSRPSGGAIAEVGAIIIVAQHSGFTRTMTTAIALETSKGDLPLALGLG